MWFLATLCAAGSIASILALFAGSGQPEGLTERIRDRPAFFTGQLVTVTGKINGGGSGVVVDDEGNAVPVAIGIGFTDTYGNEVICEFDENWRNKIVDRDFSAELSVVGIYSDFETDENGMNYIRLSDCRIVD